MFSLPGRYCIRPRNVKRDPGHPPACVCPMYSRSTWTFLSFFQPIVSSSQLVLTPVVGSTGPRPLDNGDPIPSQRTQLFPSLFALTPCLSRKSAGTDSRTSLNISMIYPLSTAGFASDLLCTRLLKKHVGFIKPKKVVNRWVVI